ncbi:hypothetical protein ATE84_4839 [Aquimarina sp. MAR_2010_214]|uniref:hypothetical protein n=1 Tax=Aquimarina sp. MAR_2010_214 TaxID=1250026 RepID=UPI000C70B2E1|nr:hypothetical protein [Aquimarina sp. MAR_2010_214]PKV52719.1 hypothetical protein ATE84_4839 [Aquimarina sp. MAR_2010_214]
MRNLYIVFSFIIYQGYAQGIELENYSKNDSLRKNGIGIQLFANVGIATTNMSDVVDTSGFFNIVGSLFSSGITVETGIGIRIFDKRTETIGYSSDGNYNSFYQGINKTSYLLIAGYEFGHLNLDQIYHGPKLSTQVFLYDLFVIGLSSSYLNGNNQWRCIVRPEIGIGISDVFSLTYQYTLFGDTSTFFPSGYDRNLFSLKVVFDIK